MTTRTQTSPGGSLLRACSHCAKSTRWSVRCATTLTGSSLSTIRSSPTLSVPFAGTLARTGERTPIIPSSMSPSVLSVPPNLPLPPLSPNPASPRPRSRPLGNTGSPPRCRAFPLRPVHRQRNHRRGRALPLRKPTPPLPVTPTRHRPHPQRLLRRLLASRTTRPGYTAWIPLLPSPSSTLRPACIPSRAKCLLLLCHPSGDNFFYIQLTSVLSALYPVKTISCISQMDPTQRNEYVFYLMALVDTITAYQELCMHWLVHIHSVPLYSLLSRVTHLKKTLLSMPHSVATLSLVSESLPLCLAPCYLFIS